MLEASGGESEPLVVLEDVLATLPPTACSSSPNAPKGQDHRETDLAAAVEQRFGILVVRSEVPG